MKTRKDLVGESVKNQVGKLNWQLQEEESEEKSQKVISNQIKMRQTYVRNKNTCSSKNDDIFAIVMSLEIVEKVFSFCETFIMQFFVLFSLVLYLHVYDTTIQTQQILNLFYFISLTSSYRPSRCTSDKMIFVIVAATQQRENKIESDSQWQDVFFLVWNSLFGYSVIQFFFILLNGFSSSAPATTLHIQT